MIKPLWALAGLALLGSTGVVGALIIASSGGDEEVAQQVETATPTVVASPSPTQSAGATPTPSPSTVPEDWPMYSDPDGRFTLRYPSQWFVRDDSGSKVKPPGYLLAMFSTFAPGTVPGFPPAALKVDFEVFVPGLGNDCRTEPEGATDATLGGVSGWQKVTPQTSHGDGRSLTVSAYNNGYCYRPIAYFGPENTDEAVFAQVIDGFQFTASTTQ